MDYYCISVRTGLEDSFCKEAQKVLDELLVEPLVEPVVTSEDFKIILKNNEVLTSSSRTLRVLPKFASKLAEVSTGSTSGRNEGGGTAARLLNLKKHMRLKDGKEYDDLFFPGYVFLETNESDMAKFAALKKVKGFYKFLPQNTDIQPLSAGDLEIVKTIMEHGTTVGIVQAYFDKDDRIVLVNGPFANGQKGKVVAVNRRNKRVNIQLDFMNGVKIIGLTYEQVRKE